MLENAVLITGASRRVGLFLAEKFLTRTDYPVIVTYRTQCPEIKRLKNLGALVFQVDLTDKDELFQFVQAFLKQVKSLRLIVHNASIWADDERVTKTPELFEQMVTLHQQVPWYLNFAFKPLLYSCSEEKSDIIHLTDSRVTMGSGQYSAYLSTKAGLENLTKSFAIQVAPKVKVNSIAPGLLMFHPDDSQAYRSKRLNEQLLPHEPGAVVIWQAIQSLMNNDYVTGVSLPVDGGVRLA